MGTQNQTPNSKTQQPGKRQPGTPGGDKQPDPRSGSKRATKGKDAGNVPRSDDDMAGEADQGTREDGAGSSVRDS
jgi:hypothetical protein